MNLKSLPRLACAAVLTVLPFSFAASAEEPGVTDTEIRIGTTNALSGGIATVCSPVTIGADAWFQKVNAEGGINGRKIVYAVLDDAYSPERAIANVRRLIDQQGVFAIVSGCATATSAAILPFLAQRPDVPYLYPYAFMSELVEPFKKNVFALPPVYAEQMTAIVPYVLDRMEEPASTGAIVSMNVPGVDQWRGTVAEMFEERGIEIVYDDTFDMSAPDKSNIVAQLKSADPDFMVIVDSGIGGARLFLEMARQNWRPKAAVSSSSLVNEAFVSAAGKEADGLLTAPAILVPTDDPRAQECNESLARYGTGIVPTDPALFGCLGAQIFAEAIRAMGSEVTREGLISALESMNGFDAGISAPVSFSADNHRGLHAIFPVAVSDGTYKVLGEPLPVAD